MPMDLLLFEEKTLAIELHQLVFVISCAHLTIAMDYIHL